MQKPRLPSFFLAQTTIRWVGFLNPSLCNKVVQIIIHLFIQRLWYRKVNVRYRINFNSSIHPMSSSDLEKEGHSSQSMFCTSLSDSSRWLRSTGGFHGVSAICSLSAFTWLTDTGGGWLGFFKMVVGYIAWKSCKVPTVLPDNSISWPVGFCISRTM